MFPVKDYDAVVVQLRTGDYLAGRRDALKKVLEIIDDVEHTEGLSKADEYGLLRMRVKELKGGQK